MYRLMKDDELVRLRYLIKTKLSNHKSIVSDFYATIRLFQKTNDKELNAFLIKVYLKYEDGLNTIKGYIPPKNFNKVSNS